MFLNISQCSPGLHIVWPIFTYHSQIVSFCFYLHLFLYLCHNLKRDYIFTNINIIRTFSLHYLEKKQINNEINYMFGHWKTTQFAKIMPFLHFIRIGSSKVCATPLVLLSQKRFWNIYMLLSNKNIKISTNKTIREDPSGVSGYSKFNLDQ
jgi:hypothetical protein